MRARSRRDGARCAPSSRTRNGGWSASSPIIPTGFSSRQHPRAARPTPRWRTRRSSGAGTSCATGLLPSASFSPGKRGSKPLAARGKGRSDSSKDDALLMGVALTQAQSWLAKRREDLPVVDRNFIDQSTKRESKARARARRAQALVYVLLVGIIAGLIGWINQAYIEEQVNWYWTMRPYMVAQVRPYVLSPDAERALKPGQAFRECAKDCPEMVVVPAGEFMMGSPPTEKRAMPDEGPQHRVTIARPFAVSKFDVTFNDWDACVSVGGCPREGRAGDVDWGRDTRPVINVSWDDAQQYVAWLSQMTGKPYRLLSDAEWEYAARAGTQTAYSWGDEIGKNNANCNGCGSQWRDGRYLANGTSRFIRRQSVRSLRHAWQRLEVGPGLLSPQLQRSTH